MTGRVDRWIDQGPTLGEFEAQATNALGVVVVLVRGYGVVGFSYIWDFFSCSTTGLGLL
jgi:hypothetical protein